MNMTDSVMMDLRDRFIYVESAGSLDECLHELSLMTRNILNAKGCAIALLSEREVEELGLRSGTEFGDMPMSRYSRCEGRGSDGSEGHDGLQVSEACGDACGLMPAGSGFDVRVRSKMFSAIVMQGKIVGVIQAYQPQQRDCFSKDDLHLFSILTLLVTKTIQVIQLQNILNSRFTQMALTRSGDKTDKTIGEIVLSSARNPNHIARILAKSFYREMTRAGFNFNQIIYAASEIISELSNNVRKHSASRKRHAGMDETREAISDRHGDPGAM